jgi:hypothetical protein
VYFLAKLLECTPPYFWMYFLFRSDKERERGSCELQSKGELSCMKLPNNNKPFKVVAQTLCSSTRSPFFNLESTGQACKRNTPAHALEVVGC